MKEEVKKCKVCGSTSNLTRDHIVPQWFTSKSYNFGFRMKSKIVFERSKIKGKYQVLCGKCNLQKGGSFDYTNPQVRAYLKIFIENLQDIIKIYE